MQVGQFTGVPASEAGRYRRRYRQARSLDEAEGSGARLSGVRNDRPDTRPQGPGDATPVPQSGPSVLNATPAMFSQARCRP